MASKTVIIKKSKKGPRPRVQSRALVVVKQPAQRSSKQTNRKGKRGGSRDGTLAYSHARSLQGSKQRFSTSADGNVLSVHGKEYFRELTTTSVFTTQQFKLNATNVLAFPKAQVLGMVFEEYCIRSLHVDYVPACPTTRSGSVTMMIDYDSSDPAPSSLLEAMSNNSSVTGAVGMPLRVSFTPKAQAQVWYYTTMINNVTETIASERQEAVGSLFVSTSHSSTADAGLVAGYLQVTYDISFRTMRPPPEAFVQTSTRLDTLLPTSGYFPPLLLESSVGFNGLSGNSAETPLPVSQPLLNAANTLLLGAGQYCVNSLWNWLAPGVTREHSKRQTLTKSIVSNSLQKTAAGSTLKEDWIDEKSDKVSLKTPRKERINKDTITATADYVEIVQHSDGTWWGLPAGSQEWELIPTTLPDEKQPIMRPKGPMAAGDVTPYLIVYDALTGAQTVLYNAVLNSGATSGVVLSKVLELSVSSPCYLAPYFTSVESRAFDQFQLGLVKTQGQE